MTLFTYKFSLRSKLSWLFILAMIAFVIWIGGYAHFVNKHVLHAPAPNLPATYHADAIMVVTGGHNRVTTAMSLFAQNTAKKLFISGVNNDVQPNDIIKETGVKIDQKKRDCCLILGHQAKNTRQNATEITNWLKNNPDIKHILLVTSDYHMPRVLIELNIKNKHLPNKVKIKNFNVASTLKTIPPIHFFKITFLEYNKFLISWTKKHIVLV